MFDLFLAEETMAPHPKPPHAHEVERLVFVRYLLHVAELQLTQPGVRAAVSLLQLHDAIEHFLALCAVSFGLPAKKGNRQFLDYWSDFASHAPQIVLPDKPQMEALNKARVALKHHGVRPAKPDLEVHLTRARDFLEQACLLLYGISFDAVSMASLVGGAAGATLQSGEASLRNGDTTACSTACAIALQQLLDAHEPRDRHGLGEFRFGRGRLRRVSVRQTARYGMDRREEGWEKVVKETQEALQEVSDAVEGMREPLRLLSFGLNLRAYHRFAHLTPHVYHVLGSATPKG